MKKISGHRKKTQGDRCTKLFHRVMNANSEKGSMRRLLIEGQWCEDEEIIKKHVKDFYVILYSETESERPFFQYLFF